MASRCGRRRCTTSCSRDSASCKVSSARMPAVPSRPLQAPTTRPNPSPSPNHRPTTTLHDPNPTPTLLSLPLTLLTEGANDEMDMEEFNDFAIECTGLITKVSPSPSP